MSSVRQRLFNAAQDKQKWILERKKTSQSSAKEGTVAETIISPRVKQYAFENGGLIRRTVDESSKQSRP